MNLSGKNILITGAAKRLGRAIALELASSGANILIHFNRSLREAVSLREEVEAFGVSAWLCPLDFSKVSSVKIRAFVRKLPVPVDCLVNNASAFYPVKLGQINDANWEGLISVNLKVPVLLSQEIGLRMKKRGAGRIVNIGDLIGENPVMHFLTHAVSKAGLMTASKALAKELAPEVCVNAVSPGAILEPPFGLTPPAKKKKAAAALLKRFGKSEDIAHAVKYLLEADYVTGQILRVDGGRSIA